MSIIIVFAIKKIYMPALKCGFKFYLQIAGARDCGPLIELYIMKISKTKIQAMAAQGNMTRIS
jgi:hypothetical protein